MSKKRNNPKFQIDGNKEDLNKIQSNSNFLPDTTTSDDLVTEKGALKDSKAYKTDEALEKLASIKAKPEGGAPFIDKREKSASAVVATSAKMDKAINPDRPKTKKGASLVEFDAAEDASAFKKILKNVSEALKGSASIQKVTHVWENGLNVLQDVVGGKSPERKIHMEFAWARLFLSDWQQFTNIPTSAVLPASTLADQVNTLFKNFLSTEMFSMLFRKLLLFDNASSVLTEPLISKQLDAIMQKMGLTAGDKTTTLKKLEGQLSDALIDIRKKTTGGDFMRLVLSSVNGDLLSNANANIVVDPDSIIKVFKEMRTVHALLTTGAIDNNSFSVREFPPLMNLFGEWTNDRVTGAAPIQVNASVVINMYLKELDMDPLYTVKFEPNAWFTGDFEMDEIFHDMDILDVLYMWHRVVELWLGNITYYSGIDEAKRLRTLGILETPRALGVTLDPSRASDLDNLIIRLLMYFAVRKVCYGDKSGAVYSEISSLLAQNARNFRNIDPSAITTKPALEGGSFIMDSMGTVIAALYDIMTAEDIFYSNRKAIERIRNSVSKMMTQISSISPDSVQVRNPLGVLQGGSISHLPLLFTQQPPTRVTDCTPFYQLPEVNIEDATYKFNDGSGVIAFFVPDSTTSDLTQALSPYLASKVNPVAIKYGMKIKHNYPMAQDMAAIVSIVGTADAKHPLAPTLFKEADKYNVRHKKDLLDFVERLGAFDMEYNEALFANAHILDRMQRPTTADPNEEAAFAKLALEARRFGWNVMFYSLNPDYTYLSTPEYWFEVLPCGLEGNEEFPISWPSLMCGYASYHFDISQEISALVNANRSYVQIKSKDVWEQQQLDSLYSESKFMDYKGIVGSWADVSRKTTKGYDGEDKDFTPEDLS